MHYTHSQKGFTLVETLIAIGILVIAVSGSFLAAQNGLSTAIYAKNEITAFYLAQEAVEQIRNIRDQNSLNGDSWLTDITDSDKCPLDTPCKIDVLTHSLSPCNIACEPLRTSPSGYYGYDPSWTLTTFKREVVITAVNGHEIEITVTMTWSKGIINRTFRVHENLFDWQ